MDQKRIVALTIFSGIPIMLGLAVWFFLRGEPLIAGVLGMAAVADGVAGLIFWSKS